MRRPTSALAKAFLGTALAATTVMVSASSSASAQQTPPPSAPAGGGSADAPAYSPMNPARGARHLVRNGWDYITYQEYERALAFFREAEARQNELTEPEKTRLRQGIERAQRGLRELASGMKPERAYARSGQPARPGAIALATPSGGIAPGSAPAPAPAPTPRFEKEPIQLAGNPGPAPGTNPNAGAVRAAMPAPAPLPAMPPESDALPLPPLAATPTEVTPAPAPAPAAAPTPAPADAVTPVAAEPAPAVEPMPAAEPAPTPSPAPAAEPVALPPAPAGGEMTLPDLPSNMPTTPAEAPVAAPAAEPTPTPIPATTAPTPAIPAELPAPELPPPAVEPGQSPASTATPTPVPATLPEPAPAAAPAAGAAPGESLPPLPLGVESEPTGAPAAVAAPSVEPPPAPPAESLPIRNTGAAVDSPPAPMDPAGGPTAAIEPSPAARPAPDSFLPRRHEVGPSTLPPTLQREVEMIAQKQDEEMRNRNAGEAGTQPGEPMGVSPGSPASTRLEISRAPSPTEARPIRAIPVPEEFVPLPKREWNPNRKYWAAAATCHMPLYFQDASLERYGYSMEQRFGTAGRFLSYPLDDPRQSKQRNQLIQPMFSAGLFAAQIALLPYNLIMDPPWESEYDLGYYRPGDRVPTDTYYLPLTGVGPPLHGASYGKPPVANSAPRW